MVLSVLALRCPTCGEELRGLDADRAWACGPCATAWEVEAGRFVARPYRALAPVVEGRGDRFHLPFWRLSVRVQAEGGDPKACAALEDVVARTGARAWLRAFWLTSAFNVGDPGQRLTTVPFEETLRATDLPRCVATRVPSSDAMRLAELFLLEAADRKADITGVTAHFDFDERALIAVPFRLFGTDVFNMADGSAYSVKALPDLASVRGFADEG